MSKNLFEIDSAMNLIKEEIIKELSESVSKQNEEKYLNSYNSRDLSFYENSKD